MEVIAKFTQRYHVFGTHRINLILDIFGLMFMTLRQACNRQIDRRTNSMRCVKLRNAASL